MDPIPEKEIVHEVKVFRGFKIHFTIYIIAILLLWIVFFGGGGKFDSKAWPLYLTLGWGAGLLIHFYLAYREFQKNKDKS